ncbi:SRPBCC family protein [Marmoricola sp. URHB0036]|uniref:SRPBCC family protein n=1 Tax=Marmoricola sp. URHB0036 TaxID=1298863 RepID=UPI000416E65A|nr:SRPBCC family protein [Marmoricola sp. URHB0036]
MAKNTGTEGLDKLKDSGSELLRNLGDKAMDTVNDKLSGLTDKLTDIGDGGPIGKATAKAGEAAAQGDNPVLGGLKGAASGIKDKITGGGGGKSGGGKATKSTNIVETIDVGVPVRVAYNQWTEFGAFPSFMKKVENAEATDDNKINFKAQIFLSHRSWEATILQQIPDECIVWRSKGQKGHVDGAVTFHEIGPNLTRILVVLEYYPQGLFEKTGNIWEAQGRRARAEVRHFRRHVMTRTILDPDGVEGWRGRIEDGEVVESHEEALEREEQEEQEADESPEDSEDEYDEEGESEDDEAEEEPEDEYDEEGESEDDEAEEEPEDEYDEEGESEDDEAEEEPEDEYDEEGEPEEDEAEEEPEEEEEESPPRRRRAS